MALAVARKGRPRMIGTNSSSSISKTTKSTGKMNLPTFTNRFSQTPMRYLIDRSASWILILVGLSLEIPNRWKRECGMRLILAPKSARVLYCLESDETWQYEATWVSFFLGKILLNNSITLLIEFNRGGHFLKFLLMRKLRGDLHPRRPSSASFIWTGKVDWMSSRVGHGGVGKGGSRVLIPDMVVMARVGASGSGVLLLSISERI
ncbi:hypothetical protein Tco_1266608 [Tanacetum coccineum]